MGVLRESLNVQLPWSDRYAEAVGIAFPGSVVPAQTTCPMCKGNRLTIYEDYSGNGYWHYCHDCQSTGDLIELAAAAWGMQLDTALVRLHRLGFSISEESLTPARLEDYSVNIVLYRKRMRAMWEMARKNLINNPWPRANWLRRRFFLMCQLSPERWLEGPGQLLGSLPVGVVEKCFCPNTADAGGKNPGRGYNCNPSAQRVFAGKEWDYVLTIPYYDLPDRLSAFLFVGRHGEPQQGDFVFRTLRHGFVHGTLRDAGIAWLPTILRQRTSRTFVALADPLLALRLQVRHCNICANLLPLLAWHDGPEARTSAAAWRALEGRQVIFWAWRLDFKLVHQAILAGGSIALAGPAEIERETISAYIRRQVPADLMRIILNQAKPWRTALSDWIDDHPDGVVEDLFLRLAQYGHSTHDLCAELGHPDRLVQLFERPGMQRTVRIGKVTVIERDGRWYCGPSRRRAEMILISDAIVRLDRAVVKNNRRTYTGTIVFKGDEVPFADVPASTLETSKAVSWLRQVVIAAGKGIPTFHGSKFGVTLFEVALAFQEPRPFPPGGG